MPKKRDGTASGVRSEGGTPRRGGAAKPKGVAKRAKREAPAGGARLRVKQIRSGIGHAATYRRTLTALGLKHHQDEVVVPDHPAVRGMLRKVWNLVSVRPVEG